MRRGDVHTPAWIGFCYLSALAALVMTVLGLAYLPLGWWERGYLAMAIVLLLQAAVTLTKTLRDRYESERNGGER